MFAERLNWVRLSAILLTLSGCSSGSDEADSNGSGGTTSGFGVNMNPAGNGGGSGNGGATGQNGSGTSGGGTAGNPDGGGTGGGSSGAGGYTGPLENVGDACDLDDPNGCIQGLCEDMIQGYGIQPGNACSRSCANDAECGSDGVCAQSVVGSHCLRKCTDDNDCRKDEYFCGSLNQDPLGTGSKVCRPKPSGRAQVTNGKAGGSCSDDADCGTGTVCETTLERRTPAPNGYCSGACFEDSDCGTGGLCVGEVRTSAGVNGQCYESCKNKDTCPAGYECRAPFTADGSLLGLVSETVCLPPPPPTALTGTTAGKVCMDDTGCPGGVCETEVVGRRSSGNGICTGTCTQASQCGTNSDCYGSNALTGTQGECLRRCTSISDCDGPTEHVCVLVNGLLDSQKYCVPRQPLEPVQNP